MRKIVLVLCVLLFLIILGTAADNIYGQGRTIIKTDDWSSSEIREWHIDEHNVTCWSYTEANGRRIALYSGFSCLPDYMLNKQINLNTNQTD